MPLGEERRKAKRVPKVATITACCDGTKKIDGAVVNISEKGMCFFTVQPLEPGHVLRVDGTFRLKNFSKDCRVIWCEEVSSDLYRIGISFE